MAEAGFLNDNEVRQYPFVSGLVPTMTRSSDSAEIDLPDSAVVDCYFALGMDALWRPDIDLIYLHAVRRNGDGSFTFEFRSTAEGLTGTAITFHRAANAPEFLADIEESLPESNSLTGSLYDGTCHDDLLWEGSLTTGTMVDLISLLAPGQTMYAPDSTIEVEPTLIQDLARTFVRAVNLGNYPRTHTDAPFGCPGASSLGIELPIIQVACLKGALAVRDGYNVAIVQNLRDNSLTFNAGVGAGAGQLCDEIPLYPFEPTPPGSPFLSGGPSCASLITSINGLSYESIQLAQGTGIAIFADITRPHTLVVRADLNNLTTCPVVPSSTASSHDSSSSLH